MRFIIGALLLCACVAGAEERAVDTKSDFRGVQFGEDLSQRADMTGRQMLAPGHGDEWLYKRDGDNLQLGPVKLLPITYRAYKHRLWAVEMTCIECPEFPRVLVSAFGEPDKRAPNGRMQWAGRSITVTFDPVPEAGGGVATLTSVRMDAAVEADKNEAAEAGKDGF